MRVYLLLQHNQEDMGFKLLRQVVVIFNHVRKVVARPLAHVCPRLLLTLALDQDAVFIATGNMVTCLTDVGVRIIAG